MSIFSVKNAYLLCEECLSTPFSGFFPTACKKVRKLPESLRTMFAGAKVQNLAGESGANFFRWLMSEG
jgi:hypothetical protein